MGVCARLYAELDRRTKDAGLADAQVTRIRNFPYLRTDRFLSSFREELSGEQEQRLWISLLRKQDQAARRLEVRNLSLRQDAFKQLNVKSSKQLMARLRQCGDQLADLDILHADRMRELNRNAVVPDSYSSTARVVGLYPFTKLFVSRGVQRLHKKIQQTFMSSHSGELRYKDMFMDYVPLSRQTTLSNSQVRELLTDSSANPLLIPILTQAQNRALFDKFAPVWEVKIHTDSDRPGRPYWTENKKIEIDSGMPEVYRLLSYTRVNGRVLIQLNYTLWFPERPLAGPFDLLGGHLDGITWRVTLDPVGRPLIYDAIHNCGCYHMFFPTEKAVFRGTTREDEEPLLVPAMAPDIRQGERMHIRLAATTHYIEAVTSKQPAQDGEFYTLVEYDTLRSLAFTKNARKSMFGVNGIVKGTDRKEKWVLWPMGVVNPGAMRQWGNHATAFIGRRHFDDPFLLERHFDFKDF